MKNNKEKIEFWLHSKQKEALKHISNETGYTISELMRRSVENTIKDMAPSAYSIGKIETPFKKGQEDGENRSKQ